MKIAEHLTKPISKILKFLLRRLVFVTVAIILQMIWMTYMVVVIGEYSKAIEWVFRIFSITVVIYIANKDDIRRINLHGRYQSFCFRFLADSYIWSWEISSQRRSSVWNLNSRSRIQNFCLDRIME